MPRETSRALSDLVPELELLARRLLGWWIERAMPHPLVVVTTHRPLDVQREAVLAGRSERMVGWHNYLKAFAVDFGVIVADPSEPGGRRQAGGRGNEDDLYRPIGLFCEQHPETRWGGWFGVPRGTSAMHSEIGWDAGHVELRGDARVRIWQRDLERAGCHPGQVDGIYGRRTREATTRLQLACGLEATGMMDPETWLRLSRLLGEVA